MSIGSKRAREESASYDSLQTIPHENEVLSALKKAMFDLRDAVVISQSKGENITACTSDVKSLSPFDPKTVSPTASAVLSCVPRINVIAQILLGARIEVFTDDVSSSIAAFDIVEVEAYVRGPNHFDTFCHTNPQLGLFGTFNFHRMGPGKSYKGGSFKGMDVTVGPLLGVAGDEKASFLAGYLIRTVRDVKTGELIEGPCLVVDTIMAAANKSSICALVDDTGRAHLNCDGTAVYKAGPISETTGKIKAAIPGDTLYSMRLIRNPQTAPTIYPVDPAESASGSPLAALLSPSFISRHILVAPRVGLIPRKNTDLRFAGALYRFVNSQPDTAADVVRLSKVRAGIVVAMVLQWVFKNAFNKNCVESPSSFVERCRRITGATNVTIEAAKKQVFEIISQEVISGEVNAANMGEAAKLLREMGAQIANAAAPLQANHKKACDNVLRGGFFGGNLCLRRHRLPKGNFEDYGSFGAGREEGGHYFSGHGSLCLVFVAGSGHPFVRDKELSHPYALPYRTFSFTNALNLIPPFSQLYSRFPPPHAL